MMLQRLQKISLLLFLALREQQTCHGNLRHRRNSRHVGAQNNSSTSLEIRNSTFDIERRDQSNNFYWETQSLGSINYEVTIGNPMRGLFGNADHATPVRWPESIPASIHGYKIGLNEIMNGDPDVVGAAAAFNWTLIDKILQTAAQFRSHAVLAFYLHWPGQSLSLPKHLVNNVDTVWCDNEVQPVWHDANLQKAILQFLQHLAGRYDGDSRILVFHAGILGKWGEWHAGECEKDGKSTLPDYLFDDLTSWYTQLFKDTRISFRYPDNLKAYNSGHGFHDGSFTFYTVSGPANGNVYKDYYFFNQSVISGTNLAYRNGIIGGEVRPENQNVFAKSYSRGTRNRQEFQLCVNLAHVTYMEWSEGFIDDGVRDVELSNARAATARMGYSYILEKVSVKQNGADKVDIEATIKQIGVAGFYYSLFLDAFCPSGRTEGALRKVASTWISRNDFSDYGQTKVITLSRIPATAACLDTVHFRLGSTRSYHDRPILWAQGSTGRVVLKIPLPPGVPEIRSQITRRQPRNIPYVPTTDIDEEIGRCYIVCAQSFCGNERVRMGEIIRGVSDEDKWKVETTGNLFSIRCDINDSDVNRVMFNWPGFDHQESWPPYIMGGHIGSTVFPVTYFMQPKRYTFTVIAYDDYNWLGQKTIDFEVEP